MFIIFYLTLIVVMTFAVFMFMIFISLSHCIAIMTIYALFRCI